MLLLIKVVLIPEKDHLVAQKRLVDLVHDASIEATAEKYAVDACADVLAQFGGGKGDFRRGGPFSVRPPRIYPPAPALEEGRIAARLWSVVATGVVRPDVSVAQWVFIGLRTAPN